ncbi:hypothetical protein HHK36_026332 [Tetracentron sinense]|uniref:Pectinesterase n=1 Tax=Tetracentron sinense TaxID=13715 RepID=A0A835D250_TETSI|nr:hypothetical protein HHK36_026332 [Tetracentron sinense]
MKAACKVCEAWIVSRRSIGEAVASDESGPVEDTIPQKAKTNIQGFSTLQFDVIVDRDGSGNFTKISDAISSAPNLSSRHYYIKIRAGVYVENIFIEDHKTNIVLIGDGMDHTIITGNRSFDGGFKTYDTATVGIRGNGFIARDITFENAAGPNNMQAVALMSESNSSAYYKCRFLGYQDTLYAKNGRQFYRECEIYGTVDFIFGNAAVVLQNSKIYARKPLLGQSNTITAQGRESRDNVGGTSIQNCTIKPAPGSDLRQVETYLGRPWKKFSRTVILQSQLDGIINPQGWSEWDGRASGLDTLYYGEYQNRGPGANTKDRVNWPGYKIITSSTEAAKFTVREFIQGNTWIPSTGIPFLPDLI